MSVPPLETVLADARSNARGRYVSADVSVAVLSVCEAVAASAEPWLRMLAEPDAQLFSGKSATWLRARHPEWARRDLATTRAGVRYYRECALPHRPDLVAAREAGRQAARAAIASPRHPQETPRAA